jgi:hypothetical protein
VKEQGTAQLYQGVPAGIGKACFLIVLLVCKIQQVAIHLVCFCGCVYSQTVPFLIVLSHASEFIAYSGIGTETRRQ